MDIWGFRKCKLLVDAADELFSTVLLSRCQLFKCTAGICIQFYFWKLVSGKGTVCPH